MTSLTVADASVDPHSCKDAQSLADSASQYAVARVEGVGGCGHSRAGRLLKPVSRYIEVMHRRAVPVFQSRSPM